MRINSAGTNVITATNVSSFAKSALLLTHLYPFLSRFPSYLRQLNNDISPSLALQICQIYLVTSTDVANIFHFLFLLTTRFAIIPSSVLKDNKHDTSAKCLWKQKFTF